MATYFLRRSSASLLPRMQMAAAHQSAGPHSTVPQGRSFIFGSSCFGPGNPDKVCDIISDAILDAHLEQDPEAKVASEVVCNAHMVMVIGEVNSSASVNYEHVVRKVIRDIGYNGRAKGLDSGTCNVIVCLEHQSDEIASGVHLNRIDEQIGAGDQGMMFGYATDETEECLPLSLVLAQRIITRLEALRRSGDLAWAGPDSKAQVNVEYKIEDGACRPLRVDSVELICQKEPCISEENGCARLMQDVVLPSIPPCYLDDKTDCRLMLIDPFQVSGQYAGCGATGRKVVSDSYGGWGSHGGGAFSGKDPTKVDRSAAYATRWIAKSFVKAGLCRRCLIQVAYAIGVARPLSVSIFTYGTSALTSAELLRILNANFDLRPGMIIRELNLKRPVYRRLAACSHFGNAQYPWERPKQLLIPEDLQQKLRTRGRTTPADHCFAP